MHFSLPCIDFCVIVKCSVDTKVLMAGRKRKIYPVLNCPNSVIEKSYDVFCLYLYFADIYQKSINTHVLIIFICLRTT